jgi:hypothetical protein
MRTTRRPVILTLIMSAFPDWQRYTVHQRRPRTGCIPTCYEILLRAAGVTGINYESFQDEFDLDRYGGAPRNHFVSVAKEIQKKYPFVEFMCDSFAKGDGGNKLARVECFIAQRKPVIVSLANAPFGGCGWHIMVVVDATEDTLTLLEYVDQIGTARTITISKKEFVRIHNEYPGGVEIAYLSNQRSDNDL